MDMGAASTSNHHQGYRNESREATQSQTACIDCRASKYESLGSNQTQGGLERVGGSLELGGRGLIWQEKHWKSTRVKKETVIHTPGIRYRESKQGEGGGEGHAHLTSF